MKDTAEDMVNKLRVEENLRASLSVWLSDPALNITFLCVTVRRE